MDEKSLERFFAKVEIADCWEWTAAKHKKGYAQFRADGSMKQAHRWLWEQLVAPLPRHLELDHRCLVRHCVNPDHLEPVTHAENVRRARYRLSAALSRRWAEYHATHPRCRYGHKFTEENTMHYKNKRQCRTCNRRSTWTVDEKLAAAVTEFVD